MWSALSKKRGLPQPRLYKVLTAFSAKAADTGLVSGGFSLFCQAHNLRGGADKGAILMLKSLSAVAAFLGLCAVPAAAQTVQEDGVVTYSGPAYQYEGKWSARLQSKAGTPIETIASCAKPIVLIAEDANTLRRSDGGTIAVYVIDDNTLSWSENGQITWVTPSSHGNFIALTARDGQGQLDPSSIVSWLRCGTAGATAAEQVCVDN